MHLSASQLSTFAECPRKWYFANVIKRIKPSTNAMLQGSLFHKAFELYFKDNYSFNDIVEYLNSAAPEQPAIVSNVIAAFAQYLTKYPDKRSEILIVNNEPSVEIGFDIAYTDDINIIGFIDYMSKRRVKTYITDIKVTSMAPTDWYFQGFELAYQTMLYSYVCSKLFTDIAGFVIDAIQIKQNKNSVKVDFATQFFPLSSNVESFERELFDTASYITKYKAQGPDFFPHCYTSCVTKYGRCPYHNICTTNEKIQIEYLKTCDDYVDKKSREENEIKTKI